MTGVSTFVSFSNSNEISIDRLKPPGDVGRALPCRQIPQTSWMCCKSL
jgi:hypothetical protein